jgi:cytochrome c oxidase subunit 2
MEFNLIALGLLFVLAHIVLVFIFWRSKRQRQPKQIAGLSSPLRSTQDDKLGSGRINDGAKPVWKFEIIPLLILTALYAGLAIAAQRLWATIRFQGASPQALQVEVTGVQFQWYFRYPGPDTTFGITRPELVNAPAGNPLGLDRTDPHSADDFVSSVLVLPAGQEVDFDIRSTDVIHGFFIPGMRVKQNAVPGMEMHIHFTPMVAGDYPILCSHVCGSGHARMQAHLQVVSEAEYAQWLAAHAIKGAGAKE